MHLKTHLKSLLSKETLGNLNMKLNPTQAQQIFEKPNGAVEFIQIF